MSPTPSVSPTLSFSSTQSRSGSSSTTRSQLASLSSSVTASTTQAATASATVSPGSSDSPTQSRTPSPTPTPSAAPYALVAALDSSTAPSAAAFGSQEAANITLSDSLAAANLALWLNRCPGLGVPLQNSVSLTCSIVNGLESVNVTSSGVLYSLTYPSGDALVVQPVELPCSQSASAVSVPIRVYATASFRSAASSSVLTCSLFGADSSAMGSVSANLAVIPTLWPLFNDVITVSFRGTMLSSIFGSVNGTDTLLRHGCYGANQTEPSNVSITNSSDLGCGLEV